CRHLLVFLFTVRPPPVPTLFPYTTLFRSSRRGGTLRTTHSVRAGKCRTTIRRRRCGASQAGRAPAGLPNARASREPQGPASNRRSEEHTSELQSRENLVCRLLLEKKKTNR